MVVVCIFLCTANNGFRLFPNLMHLCFHIFLQLSCFNVWSILCENIGVCIYKYSSKNSTHCTKCLNGKSANIRKNTREPKVFGQILHLGQLWLSCTINNLAEVFGKFCLNSPTVKNKVHPFLLRLNMMLIHNSSPCGRMVCACLTLLTVSSGKLVYWSCECSLLLGLFLLKKHIPYFLI